MLRNFVATSDLAKHDVAITSYYPSGTTSWATQITEAFELVKDKLRAKKLRLRSLGLPMDLSRAADSSADQNVLTSLTKTATYSMTHVDSREGFSRFAVNVTANTGIGAGVFSFALQGSNDADVDDDTEPTNWSTIATISPTANGETTSVFQDEYKYYRYVLTVTGSSKSITYTCSLYETYQDRWIIWLTLSMIYKMISKSNEDIWMKKSKDAFDNFDMAFNTYVFQFDSNDNNLPDTLEAVERPNPYGINSQALSA